MKYQSETKRISADGNRLFFRRLASWQAPSRGAKAHKRTKAAFCRVVPVAGEVIKSQQIVAPRFAHPGLIPKPVNVSDTVWKWTPGS